MGAYVFMCAYICVHVKARAQHWVPSTFFSNLIFFFLDRVSP